MAYAGEPKRILIIVENLPVPFDRRVWMEATTLKKAGYEVSVISPKGKGFTKSFEVLEGIFIYRHYLPPERSSSMGYIREYAAALWHEWRLARRVWHEHGFEVIHACNPPDLIFLVAIWFKAFHCTKFLFDHHDLNPELYESKFERRGFFYKALKLAERCTFWLADTVISTNESYREVAIRRGGKTPEHVFVVRSGPDLGRFNAVPPKLAYKNERQLLVGYLGVMGEFDGVHHLVEAAHEIVHKNGRRDIQFCFIGDGPTRKSLIALARERSISEFCDFTGRVPDAEMIERLSSCDVCVAPDPLNPLNDKSTMNKILEYMALKKAVVQYNLVEGRRSAGGASLYAKPNNVPELASKILYLLDNPGLRDKMGEMGRKRMESKLEWRHQAPVLLKVYEGLYSKLNDTKKSTHHNRCALLSLFRPRKRSV